MNTDIKQQVHKEFDEKFPLEYFANTEFPYNYKVTPKEWQLLDWQDRETKKAQYKREYFKAFLDSLIDKTVQMAEERIVKEMKDWANKNYNRSTQPLYAWVDASDLVERLSLITNKNDINK